MGRGTELPRSVALQGQGPKTENRRETMGFSGVMGVGTPQHLTAWAWRWGEGASAPLSMPRGPGLPHNSRTVAQVFHF